DSGQIQRPRERVDGTHAPTLGGGRSGVAGTRWHFGRVCGDGNCSDHDPPRHPRTGSLRLGPCKPSTSAGRLPQTARRKPNGAATGVGAFGRTDESRRSPVAAALDVQEYSTAGRRTDGPGVCRYERDGGALAEGQRV